MKQHNAAKDIMLVILTIVLCAMFGALQAQTVTGKLGGEYAAQFDIAKDLILGTSENKFALRVEGKWFTLPADQVGELAKKIEEALMKGSSVLSLDEEDVFHGFQIYRFGRDFTFASAAPPVNGEKLHRLAEVRVTRDQLTTLSQMLKGFAVLVK